MASRRPFAPRSRPFAEAEVRERLGAGRRRAAALAASSEPVPRRAGRALEAAARPVAAPRSSPGTETGCSVRPGRAIADEIPGADCSRSGDGARDHPPATWDVSPRPPSAHVGAAGSAARWRRARHGPTRPRAGATGPGPRSTQAPCQSDHGSRSSAATNSPRSCTGSPCETSTCSKSSVEQRAQRRQRALLVPRRRPDAQLAAGAVSASANTSARCSGGRAASRPRRGRRAAHAGRRAARRPGRTGSSSVRGTSSRQKSCGP